jgi:hypothetical protein
MSMTQEQVIYWHGRAVQWNKDQQAAQDKAAARTR